ncbi:hypothetical protein ONZ51_g570 [Trametes cubensis]|uniref:Uncharacterized protein n=1 Tax=Trametes cubensis TaxID=1111947 RepID=A0AAD7U300_9APHY|nr:hypothetical protein ONZ51_g570 [Trametes cubensis]
MLERMIPGAARARSVRRAQAGASFAGLVVEAQQGRRNLRVLEASIDGASWPKILDGETRLGTAVPIVCSSLQRALGIDVGSLQRLVAVTVVLFPSERQSDSDLASALPIPPSIVLPPNRLGHSLLQQTAPQQVSPQYGDHHPPTTAHPLPSSHPTRRAPLLIQEGPSRTTGIPDLISSLWNLSSLRQPLLAPRPPAFARPPAVTP